MRRVCTGTREDRYTMSAVGRPRQVYLGLDELALGKREGVPAP